MGAHSRAARRKRKCSCCLQFAKDHVDKPEGYWKNVLWKDETKIEHFGLNERRYVWRKENATFQHKNFNPFVKSWWWQYHDLACFAASGPGWLAILGETMNSELYQQILNSKCQDIFLCTESQENVGHAARQRP